MQILDRNIPAYIYIYIDICIYIYTGIFRSSICIYLLDFIFVHLFRMKTEQIW